MQAVRMETIALPADLDRAAADALLTRLQGMVSRGVPAALDACHVERLSYPAAQVILSWSRTQADAIVCRPSAAFQSALGELGVGAEIALTDNLPPPLAPVVEAAATPSEAVADAPALDESAAPAAKRILTIDDSKTMRDMLRLSLERTGFEVLQAVDGQDGLDVLAREEVDVIITDINMPRMDGYGVIENVRRDSKYDATPILVLTTESDREKKDRARDLGATGFIVKPFDPSKLVDVIYKVSP